MPRVSRQHTENTHSIMTGRRQERSPEKLSCLGLTVNDRPIFAPSRGFGSTSMYAMIGQVLDAKGYGAFSLGMKQLTKNVYV